ncbi:hypothetical protein [Acaryochloris marina]|uniref:Collagen-like protein n=1 Tax=Acaryochloris marina (strain MBIC 11017) TaxID=329726 RepID=B0BYZ5_ACAM1|nr:hypothetical protein [Acaryochloris marina]ABW28295.1 conserved hypothetical protein [Acaryochloris marina MBIC11017]BDM77321.1 hypothetical protein AM10699_01950 [Acaryochloris marina MBIC10699]
MNEPAVLGFKLASSPQSVLFIPNISMRFLKRKLYWVLGLCACTLTLLLGHFSPFSAAYSPQPVQPTLQPLIAWGTQTFGGDGRKGRDGANGRNGTSGQETQIRLTGSPMTVDVAGSSGTSGQDGQLGENAYGCDHSAQPTHNLTGADGGRGGRGGNGGRGGDGGKVWIYYAQSAQLKALTLNNAGGQGGQAGLGAPGGYGCGCVDTAWQVNYCEWQRYRKQRGVADAPWIKDKTKTYPCTGSQRIDHKRHHPTLDKGNSQWAYRWEYGGVYKTEHFHCTGGAAGKDGQDGQAGREGRYGQVVMVPREDIPQEKVQYYAPLEQLMGQQVDLVKNIWTEKSGLRSQLHPNSKVPDTYTYLDSTARLNYRIDWNAPKSPTELEVSDTKIGATIQVQNNQGQLDFELPGTLEYQLKQQDPLTVMTITGGFSPNRVQSFRIDEEASQRQVGQLVLVDDGDVRSLLQNTKLKVTCLSKQSASGLKTDTYQVRHSVELRVPPIGRSSDGVGVDKNVYTLNVQPFFSAWLKPGYDIQYQVKVEQTTKSNAVYTQTQTANLPVPLS